MKKRKHLNLRHANQKTYLTEKHRYIEPLIPAFTATGIRHQRYSTPPTRRRPRNRRYTTRIGTNKAKIRRELIKIRSKNKGQIKHFSVRTINEMWKQKREKKLGMRWPQRNDSNITITLRRRDATAALLVTTSISKIEVMAALPSTNSVAVKMLTPQLYIL